MDGGKRPYRSDRRTEQAEETRRRILDAAGRVFVDKGFGGTTIESVAREAAVSAPTVYATFRNKRRLLAETVRHAVRGGGRLPLLDQEGPQAVRDAGDQARQLHLFARDITDILERVGPLMGVLGAAAAQEPEIAELRDRLQDARLANHRTMIGWLTRNGPLREGLTDAAAADLSWTLASPDVHQLLRRDRRWSKKRFAEWLEGALARLLLPDDHTAAR